MTPDITQDQEPTNDELEQKPEEVSDADAAIDILSKYWPNEKDPEKLWSILIEKEEECYAAMERRNLFAMWRLVYGYYFGLSGSTGANLQWQTQQIQFGGENGELLMFSVNQFRSFVDQILSMTTKTRPAFQVEAVNTDYKSQAQVQSSDTLVTYYYEQYYGERRERELAKFEELYGKAYTHLEWDPDGGPDVEWEEEAPSPDGPITTTQKGKAGEFIVSVKYPWEVICEPYRSELTTHAWRMTTGAKISKWEAVARWPLKAEAIDSSTYVSGTYSFQFPGTDPLQKEPEGTCAKRVFYHANTLAVPGGRRVTFINDVMVSDDKLGVDNVPIYPLMATELHTTSFGISDLWNLLPIDQMRNQIMSDIATNLEAFGRPPLSIVEGSDIDLDALANGQKVIFVPSAQDRPEAIKFPTTPDAGWKMLDVLNSLEQSLSGLNAIARGDTSTNITSGAHAALYSQIAVEAQSARALDIDMHREAVANGIVAHLKAYAKHPQLVAVAGVDERSYLETFTEKDFSGIHRVIVKTANPAIKTQAGRMQLLEMMMDLPGQPIKDPQQLITLASTGQMKPALDPTRIAEMRIKAENEALAKGPATQDVPGDIDPMTGQPVMNKTVPEVPVLATDNATQHIVNHLNVINGPAATKNPAVMQAALTHILEHVRLARSGDPYLAQLLSLPMPEQMGGAPAPGGAAPAQQPQQEQGAGANGSGPTPAQSNAVKKIAQDPKDDSNSSLPSPAQPPADAANVG